MEKIMEYLLTKVDHKDKDAVHAAYSIYEMTLNESYSIMDIKDAILDARGKAKEEQVELCETIQEDIPRTIKKEPEVISSTKQKKKRKNSSKSESWWRGIIKLLNKTPSELITKKESKTQETQIVYPTETQPERMQMPLEIHPTVCLSMGG